MWLALVCVFARPGFESGQLFVTKRGEIEMHKPNHRGTVGAVAQSASCCQVLPNMRTHGHTAHGLARGELRVDFVAPSTVLRPTFDYFGKHFC